MKKLVDYEESLGNEQISGDSDDVKLSVKKLTVTIKFFRRHVHQK